MRRSSSSLSAVVGRVWPHLVAAVMIGYVIVLLTAVASDVTATGDLLRGF